MESLATNEEQVIKVEDGDEERGDLGEDIVAGGRDFFREADEVLEALRSAVRPELETKACRARCERIGFVWSQYQEQPGLLDPQLEQMVELLMGAVGSAVRAEPSAPLSALPNLHLLTSLLYLLTTVRGYKTVSRFFPHEVADLEPCLEAVEAEARDRSGDTWSTLYCMTLWLGMVLLTPFDLASIDSGGQKGLAARILELGQEGLKSASRTRDASAWMLAKFFMRHDVTNTGGLQSFTAWTSAVWADAATPDGTLPRGALARLGSFQAWSQILKAAPRAVLRPVSQQLLRLALQGPLGPGGADFKASSTLRKLRVKVAVRAAIVSLPPRLAPWRYQRGARSLIVNFEKATATATASGGQAAVAADGAASAAAFAARAFEPPPRGAAAEAEVGAEEDEEDDDVLEEIEEVIELLIDSLGDSDTVVRWSGAKGVGRVTNRLSRDFGDQVLETLMERCFSFRETDKAWHGGCLALAELTRRGLLLPARLPAVVPLVCKALHFEQVSGKYAVGQHVRDAACYVCWAFARAYAPDTLEPFVGQVATNLIQVAVFDREVNCRRAAAAAMQEHVGRQGTFPNGIDVVTLADYWTLSVRRNAYLVVAPQLAAYGTYREHLIDHLVERKLVHQDVQIRLLAGDALSALATAPCSDTAARLNSHVLPALLARALGDASPAPGAAASGGPSVHARHGAVVGIAALVAVLQAHVSTENQNAIRGLVPGLEKARAYRGRGGEVIRQAACVLLQRVAAAQTWAFKDATCARYLQTVDECARHSSDAVQVAAVDALRELAHTRFKQELLEKCVDTYIAGLRKVDETIAARRGFALCLGALPPAAYATRRSEVTELLCKEVRGQDLPGGKDMEDPQTRQYAVLSLGRVLLADAAVRPVSAAEAEHAPPCQGAEFELIVSALTSAMGDYAVDRRGDVGSWVRETAMEVLASLLLGQRLGKGAPLLAGPDVTTKLVALLVQQAVEKIDRLRERALLLLYVVLCGSAASSSAYTPGTLIELAQRRVLHSEAYAAPVAHCDGQVGAEHVGAASWPPADLAALTGAFREAAVASGMASPAGDGRDAERGAESHLPTSAKPSGASAAAFDAAVPLVELEAYRPAVALGLVVSVGGLTESTALESRRALLKHLRGSSGCDEARVRLFSGALLALFDRVGVADNEPEAKRLLASVLTAVGKLLAEALVLEETAFALYERSFAAVRRSRDVSRLLSSVAVFIGLMRWPGEVRRKSLGVLLWLLGFSYPVVRQTAAKALYIRFLEVEGTLDLRTSLDDGRPNVSAEAVAAVSEAFLVTPWATDDEAALKTSLHQVYSDLDMDLPQGGRSIVSKKPTEAQKVKESTGNQYADLVREAHF